jgi:hypothetical protein
MRRMRTTNKEAVENTRQRRSRGARTFDVHKEYASGPHLLRPC